MENNEVNILKFEPKQKQVLNNDEIMKVFLGLMRLISKNAEYEAIEKVKLKLDNYRSKLNKVTKELKKRTLQVEQLLELNENLLATINENNIKLL